MFTRHRFIPSVDGLCSRIAPSAVVAAPASLLAATVAHHSVSQQTSVAATDMPHTGTASTPILAPTPSTPPTTLLC
jgi:hypothetical protein